jgi:hypothetical protein
MQSSSQFIPRMLALFRPGLTEKRKHSLLQHRFLRKSFSTLVSIKDRIPKPKASVALLVGGLNGFFKFGMPIPTNRFRHSQTNRHHVRIVAIPKFSDGLLTHIYFVPADPLLLWGPQSRGTSNLQQCIGCIK